MSKRPDRPFDTADPLTKRVVKAMALMFSGFYRAEGHRAGTARNWAAKQLLRDGSREMIEAIRDIASKGELRNIESEMGYLLDGMTSDNRSGVNDRT